MIQAWSLKALNGEPGVYSARYGGSSLTTDQQRYEFLLKNLQGISNRNAYFICVIAVYIPGKPLHFATGKLEGQIIDSPRGDNGFGYDPIFELPDGRTLAELHSDDKNIISHRGRALQAVLPFLRQVL